MSTKTIEQMCEHLQFLGYEISIDEKVARAKHQSHFNMSLRVLSGGVLISSLFGGTAEAKQNRTGLLEFVNGMNEKAGIARFYCDKDSDLFVEAWHPDNYESSEFGAFVEAWHRECGLLEKMGGRQYLD